METDELIHEPDRHITGRLKENQQRNTYVFQQLNDPFHLANAARVLVSCHSRLGSGLRWIIKLECCFNFVIYDFLLNYSLLC